MGPLCVPVDGSTVHTSWWVLCTYRLICFHGTFVATIFRLHGCIIIFRWYRFSCDSCLCEVTACATGSTLALFTTFTHLLFLYANVATSVAYNIIISPYKISWRIELPSFHFIASSLRFTRTTDKGLCYGQYSHSRLQLIHKDRYTKNKTVRVISAHIHFLPLMTTWKRSVRRRRSSIRLLRRNSIRLEMR